MFGFEMTDYDKKVYEEELREFLPKNIVDSHTHIYPEAANKYKPGPKYWPSRVAETFTIEDAVQTYKDLFPEQNVVPVILGTVGGHNDVTNAYSSEKSKEYGYPALFVNDFYDTPEFLEEKVISGGFHGLKPYFYGCRKEVNGNDAEIYDFIPESHFKVADKHGWKVLLHISRPDRLKDPKNLTTLMEIEQKYPNVKLIVAHIGRAYAPEDIGNAFDILKNTKNMMFDFSANTLSLATEKCIEAVGTKRVLFGLDFPVAKMRMRRIVENGYYINVVPKGMYGDLTGAAHMRETEDYSQMTNFTYEIIRSFKRTAEKLSLTKKDVEDVMCNNAATLYNIKF